MAVPRSTGVALCNSAEPKNLRAQFLALLLRGMAQQISYGPQVAPPPRPHLVHPSPILLSRCLWLALLYSTHFHSRHRHRRLARLT